MICGVEEACQALVNLDLGADRQVKLDFHYPKALLTSAGMSEKGRC